VEPPSVAQHQPPEDPDESRQWTRENPELALEIENLVSAANQ
jgi:hypothetical protein